MYAKQSQAKNDISFKIGFIHKRELHQEQTNHFSVALTLQYNFCRMKNEISYQWAFWTSIELVLSSVRHRRYKTLNGLLHNALYLNTFCVIRQFTCFYYIFFHSCLSILDPLPQLAKGGTHKLAPGCRRVLYIPSNPVFVDNILPVIIPTWILNFFALSFNNSLSEIRAVYSYRCSTAIIVWTPRHLLDSSVRLYLGINVFRITDSLVFFICCLVCRTKKSSAME